MDKEPANRPSMACYEKVVTEIAKDVEDATAEDAAQGDRAEDGVDIGLDLDGDGDGDEDCEDNELF